MFQPDINEFVWRNQPIRQNLTKILTPSLLSQQRTDKHVGVLTAPSLTFMEAPPIV